MTPLVDRALVRHWRRIARRMRPVGAPRQRPWHSRPVMIDRHLWRAVAVIALTIVAGSTPATALGLLAWWQLLGCLGRAGDFQAGLGDRLALTALRLLPTPDARIAWAMTARGRRDGMLAGGETVVVGAVAVLTSDAPGWAWAGLPFAAIASAGFQMTIAAWLVRWRPMAPWALIQMAGVGMAVGAAILDHRVNLGTPAVMAGVGLFATPFGWGLQILPRGAGSAPDAIRILVGAAAGAAALAITGPAMITLARSFRMGEDRAEPDDDPAPTPAPADPADGTAAATAGTTATVAADDRVLAAWSTARAAPPAAALADGPLGGWLARRPRATRWMMEILAPEPSAWWRRRRSVLLAAMGVVMALGASGVIPGHLPAVAAVVAVITLLPFQGGPWAGIDRGPMARWPLGMGAFLGAVLEVNAVRVLTRIPLYGAVLLMTLITMPSLRPHGLALAVGVLTAALAAVPFGAAVLLGRQTSLATGMLSWRRLPLALALVLPTVGGVLALTMIATARHPLPALIGAIVTLGCAGTVLGLMVLAIRRRWCDLA
jgi:hypothetical protein